MIRVSTANIYQQSVNGINADQSGVLTTEAELSSGLQVNSPSDNPVAAAQSTLLQSDLSQLGQYTTNQNQATQLLNNASSTLTSVVNVMQSVRTTLVQAGNPTMSDANRGALAAELQQSLNQIVGLANSSDTQGGYLFGGSVTTSPPFVQNGNNVSYAGDSLVQGLQISQSRTEQVRYAGSTVFMNIPTGNGSFATAASATNTGTGTISTGTVTAPASLTGDNYTITVLPTGTDYQVTDNTTGNVVVGSSPLSPPSTTVSFDGMQMALGGTPAAGDTFSVAPAGTQSIFNILSAAITALQTPSGSQAADAQRTAAVTTALGNTDQALASISTTQSSMGAQLSELNTYGTVNADRTLQDKTENSSLVDLNYASAASKLTQQQTQYQAALQSYSAISKLSLFNYM